MPSHPTNRKEPADGRRRPAHDHRALGVRGLRGGLEGVEHPAHPAHVGRERDPRHHPGRCDHRRRAGVRRLDPRDRPARRGAGDRQPRRRVRRDRPDARDVPRPQAKPAASGTDAPGAPVPRVPPVRRRPVDDAPLPHLDRDPLPDRRRLLHPRPQGPELAEDRPPRQPDRRRGRDHRGRSPCSSRRSSTTSRGSSPPSRSARPSRHRGPARADDADAPARRALQRRRRRRGGARRTARARPHG